MVTTNPALLKKRTQCHILKSLYLNVREHRAEDYEYELN